MTDKEILYKVIQKLKEDGTLPDSFNLFYRHGAFDTDIIKYWINNNLIESIIFSTEFAKAFWGKDKICFHCNGDSKDWVEGTCPECFLNPKYRSKWQYNLQQMVICEERLKYLEKFL